MWQIFFQEKQTFQSHARILFVRIEYLRIELYYKSLPMYLFIKNYEDLI